uniref:Uncharacterized protein n=1 Tax=Panagrolaimus davidi TaxID=227884 RepID=A0A914P348_9BILA
MNTKLFVFAFLFFMVAFVFAAGASVEGSNNVNEYTTNSTTTNFLRVKRGGDKGCNTLIPVCVQTMCNQCCNEGCKGQDCWQPMCSLCCS